MNSNTFKNADIDRKNEETNTEYSCGNCGHQFKDEADWSGNCDEHSCCYCECDCSDCASLDCDDEPTMDCARCGRRGLGEEQVCIREWEGDSDAPMCAPCWDTTEQEEDEAFAMENIAELLGETPIVYEDPDKVSAEIVEEEETEVFGKCDECGMEGKFFGKEGDDWTCAGCLCGNDNGTDDSDDDEDPKEYKKFFLTCGHPPFDTEDEDDSDDDEEWAYDCVVCKKHLYITELAKCEERDLCAYCCVGENRRGCPCYVCVANNEDA